MTTRALAERVKQLGQPLACLDIETTGGHTERDRMTEIGVVSLRSDGAQERWCSLINPQRWIPTQITRLTGSDEAMVVDAPSFNDLAAELFERLEGSILVAHNG